MPTAFFSVEKSHSVCPPLSFFVENSHSICSEFFGDSLPSIAPQTHSNEKRVLQAKTYNTLCLWVLKYARRGFKKYSEIFPKNTEIFPKMFERILQKSEIFSKRWEQSNALRSESASLTTSRKGFAQGKKSRSVYFFSCTLSLGLAVFSVLAV